MSKIKQFQTFQAATCGWGKVTFKEFHKQLAPLKYKATWADEDVSYVTRLQEQGAGYALRLFFGPDHSEAARVLQTDVEKPAMSKDETEFHLRGLIRSCRQQNWASDDYIDYIKYLDGSESPAEMRQRAINEEKQKSAAAGLPPPEPPADAPEEDRFAEFYRNSCSGIKQRVRQQLLDAASLNRS